MRISGTEPSSVILSQKREWLESDVPKVPNNISVFFNMSIVYKGSCPSHFIFFILFHFLIFKSDKSKCIFFENIFLVDCDLSIAFDICKLEHTHSAIIKVRRFAI